MKISDIGEFGFIDAIKADTLYHKENVVVGIGDDGAQRLSIICQWNF